MSLQLEKLQAAGYKPVLLLGTPGKKSHAVQVFLPRCTLTTYTEQALKDMRSIHEYVCQGTMFLYFINSTHPQLRFVATKILIASC